MDRCMEAVLYSTAFREREDAEKSRAGGSVTEEIEDIKLQEVARELRKMENGRSPGVCEIQVELLKTEMS